jgi:hypothetical protein
MRDLPLAGIALLGLLALGGALLWNSSAAATAERQAVQRLTAADGATPTAQIVADLESIRRLEAIEDASAASLLKLASESAPLYANRDKREAARLRPYALLVLAEVAGAHHVLSHAVDLVAHGHKPYEVAVGARVVALAGREAKWTESFVAAAVVRSIHDEPLSLARFALEFSPEEQTTGRIELVRALMAVDPEPALAAKTLSQLHLQHTYGKSPGEKKSPLQLEIEHALAVLGDKPK